MEEGPRVNSRGSLTQLIHLHFKKLPLPVQAMLTAGARLARGPCEPSLSLWRNVPVWVTTLAVPHPCKGERRAEHAAPGRQAGRRGGGLGPSLQPARAEGHAQGQAGAVLAAGDRSHVPWSALQAAQLLRQCDSVTARGGAGDALLGTSAVQNPSFTLLVDLLPLPASPQKLVI